MKTKNIAFTLAETLVVMGIIGVIAALTIPNLSQSTGNRERVTKVKKAYALIGEAIDRATAVYGPVEEWFDNSDSTKTTRFGDRVTEFMKLSKKCGISTNENCLPNIHNDNDRYYKFILADGISVGFFMQSGNLVRICTYIDGTKGKGEAGKDQFVFYYDYDNATPKYCPGLCGSETDFDYLLTMLSRTSKDSATSAYWVINYDNMDYLKLTSEGKCPNETIPTESNPRCN